MSVMCHVPAEDVKRILKILQEARSPKIEYKPGDELGMAQDALLVKDQALKEIEEYLIKFKPFTKD